MEIEIRENDHHETLLFTQMIGQAGVAFEMADRVPNVSGKAFDLYTWYRAWSKATTAPTHMHVEASDQFQATVPWEELGQAAFLFEQNNAPLVKGYPLRLYVPDGSSACLNVKSVIRIQFLHEPDSSQPADFGFKNHVSVNELSKKR